MSAVQLEQPVNSPIYDARQQFTAAEKPHRVSVNFLRSPTAAVIESALLMLLIGWIDYKTTDFAITVFYFGPVVLATWRAGRKAGWFIAALAERQCSWRTCLCPAADVSLRSPTLTPVYSYWRRPLWLN
jgi:hypothetical protein